METAYGDKKFTVCIYELLGTATLMLAVVMTGGNALYVCFTLWAILMISGGITGGHFNPAVSTGVFIWQRKYDEHFALYSAVVASQFAGALLGMMTGYLLIGNFTDEWYEEHPDGAVPSEWVPVFAP
jgi:glycerol uptake facilitator-like aquaporin